MMKLLEAGVLLFALFDAGVSGFSPRTTVSRWGTRICASATDERAPPRTGFSQTLLNFALESPLWKLVLVPQARANIVKTAEANSIPWNKSKMWIKENCDMSSFDDISVPEYYRRAFHAYEDGNLCWDAALEVEIASCAVGARNFPQYGSNGEAAFRGAFASALEEAGAIVPEKGKILDMGCGTGMSTRRLAKTFSQASVIKGIDLSPYFISIGTQLLKLEPTRFDEGGTWVSNISYDDRIEYILGDAGSTGLQSESFDIVNLQFVVHELPADATRDVIVESLRVLKPGGQLWISEMDFEAPAYAEQRANALLFALVRSTEPFLDEYAESISPLFKFVQSMFEATTVVPATGRHYALVAFKGNAENKNNGSFTDLRFDDNGQYRVDDTHLKVWESKEN
jgi:ubiquinone/menaquinone biosynthesis C-methylase UbiE